MDASPKFEPEPADVGNGEIVRLMESFKARLKTEEARDLVEKIFSSPNSLELKNKMCSALCSYPSAVADDVRGSVDKNFPIGHTIQERTLFFTNLQLKLEGITSIVSVYELDVVLLGEAIAYTESRPDLYKNPKLKNLIIAKLSERFPRARKFERSEKIEEHDEYEALDKAFVVWVKKMLVSFLGANWGTIAASHSLGVITDASVRNPVKEEVDYLKKILTKFNHDRNRVNPDLVFAMIRQRWEKWIDENVPGLITQSLEHKHNSPNNDPQIAEDKITKIKLLLREIVMEALKSKEI